MNVIRGTVAEGTETPPRPFRIRSSGRLDPDPAEWTSPLPPLLAKRLPAEQREQHERTVATWGEAASKAREQGVKARQAAVDDEQALREAVASGSKPPKPKAVTAEAAAAEAQRAEEMAAVLVLESGRELAAGFSDDDLAAAIGEAKAQAAALVEALPELVDGMVEQLQEAGRLGGEAAWCGGLRERRIVAPWRPSSAPATHRLAAAAAAAQTLRERVLAELEERDWKAAPVEHHAPAGAPPVGAWVSGEVDPTK